MVRRGVGRWDSSEENNFNKTTSKLLILLLVALLATKTCPDHTSYESHLADHPLRLLRLREGLTFHALLEAAHAKFAASSTRYFAVLRVGRLGDRRAIGLFGTWLELPAVFTPAGVCAAGLATNLVLLCVAGRLLWGLCPRFMNKHAVASLDALRQGRIWTLLSSSLSHATTPHLLQSCVQLELLGPLLQSALGCGDFAVLLVALAVASASASTVWHGALGGQPRVGSLGAGGVIVGLAAAHARLFPHALVRPYGFELDSRVLLLLQLVSDYYNGALDWSAHVGGGAAGWLLAQMWRQRGTVWPAL